MANHLPQEILQQTFGYKEFRGKQAEVIDAVLQKKDVLAVLPTGAGKSLCYQIPALRSEGICVVISPLIALITDQIEHLRTLNLKALNFTGSLSDHRKWELLDNMKYGNYPFMFISPERIQDIDILEQLRLVKVSLVVIDEAHCISEWGNDFRPAYRSIHRLRTYIDAPFLALTASATEMVRQDIISNLEFRPDYQLFVDSFLKANLGYYPINTQNKRNLAVQLLRKNTQGVSIVYVFSRREAEELSGLFNEEGITADFYHGNITARQKKEKLEQWLQEKTSCMVATTAFGMGINKANVRTVIHLKIPESIEAYYQETGRAGRDGLSADTYVLYDNQDIQRFKDFFLKYLPNFDKVKLVLEKLYAFLQIPEGEGEEQTYQFPFLKFCRRYNFPEQEAYHALMILNRIGVLEVKNNLVERLEITLLAESSQLIDARRNADEAYRVLDFLLRTYGGSMHRNIQIKLEKTAQLLNLNENHFLFLLKRLQDHNIIQILHHTADTELYFKIPRERDYFVNRNKKNITTVQQNKRSQVEAILNLITQDQECITQRVLAYFDEAYEPPCNRCSFCKSKATPEDLAQQIVDLLKQSPLSPEELLVKLDCQKKSLFRCLDQLIHQEVIGLNPALKFELND
ncbi:MAG: RecQ family ATP-dependent DNA helicase [Flavobacteriaceae bacterium]|nr:RecQ family ATP-dependent DNA helicase [Flavobacteriaceae bacterium]